MKWLDKSNPGNISEYPKLPNVFNGARSTVTKLPSILDLSHVTLAISVVHTKILGRWDMFSAC